MPSLSARGGVVAYAIGGRAQAVGRVELDESGAWRADVSRPIELDASSVEVEGVRLSDDGRAAVAWGAGASSSSSGEVRLIDVATGERRAEWRLDRPARKVRFNPDGRTLLATERGGEVALLSEGGVVERLVSPPGLPLDALLFASEAGERRLAICDRDEKIRVCAHPHTFDVVSFCLGHEEFVSSLERLPHAPHLLVSSGGDCTARLWNPETGEQLASISPSTVDRRAISNFVCSLSPDGNSSTLFVNSPGSSTIETFAIAGRAAKLDVRPARTIHLDEAPFAMAADEAGRLWTLEAPRTLRAYGGGRLLGELALEGPPLERCDDELEQMFKRKVDNLQEYTERKRRRLEGRS